MQFLLRIVTRAVLIAAGLSFSVTTVFAGEGFIRTRQGAIPGEYLVALPSGAKTADTAKAIAEDYGGELREVWEPISGFWIHIANPTVAEAMSADPRIEFIEQNQALRVSASQATKLDPATGAATLDNRVWHLDRIDQDTPELDGQYNYCSAGEGVYVYVVDLGVTRDHHEFDGVQVLPGHDTTGEDQATGPCNGFPAREYIPTTGSIDFNAYNNAVGSTHGTAVASLVVGKNVGVAKRATLIPVKVSECGDFPDWIARRPYRLGEIARISTIRFRATRSGVSGATRPSSTGTNITGDGTVNWERVVTAPLQPPLPSEGKPQAQTSRIIAGLCWILGTDLPIRKVAGDFNGAVASFSTYDLVPATGVGTPATDACSTPPAGSTLQGLFERAVGQLHEAGVTVFASANNQLFNACGTVPPSREPFGEVITMGGSMLLNDPDGDLFSGVGFPAADAPKRRFPEFGAQPDPALPKRDALWVCGPGDSDACGDAGTDPISWTLGSNFGSCVTLFAPSKNMHSAQLSGPYDYRDRMGNNTLGSGTSYAAPLGAGVAARLLSMIGPTDPAVVRRTLLNTSIPNVLDEASLRGSDNLLLRASDIMFVNVPDESVVVCPGEPRELQVLVTSPGPVSYEWFRGADRNNPAGATRVGGNSPTLNIAQLDQTSYYFVRVTSSCSLGGTVVNTSRVIPARVRSSLSFATPKPTASPSRQILIGAQAPQSVTLTAPNATLGSRPCPSTSGPITYIWYEGETGQDGVEVGRGSSLTFTPQATKNYWVRARIADNNFIDSAPVPVEVRRIGSLVADRPSVPTDENAEVVLQGDVWGLDFVWNLGTTVAPCTTSTCRPPIPSGTHTLTVAELSNPSRILGSVTLTSCTPSGTVTIQRADLTQPLGTNASGSHEWFEGRAPGIGRSTGVTTNTFNPGPSPSDRWFWVRVSSGGCYADSRAYRVLGDKIGRDLPRPPFTPRLLEGTTLVVDGAHPLTHFQWYIGAKGDTSRPVGPRLDDPNSLQALHARVDSNYEHRFWHTATDSNPERRRWVRVCSFEDNFSGWSDDQHQCVDSETATLPPTVVQCPVTSLSRSEIVASPSGGSFPVALQAASTCSWTVTVTDASGQTPDWIDVNPKQGTGNAQLTVTVTASGSSLITRTATISVGGKTITVTQRNLCPHQIIPQQPTDFTSAATSGRVFVNANNDCTWTARPINSAWVHLSGADASGAETGTGARFLTFTLDRNLSTKPRTGEIRIGDQTYVFNQKGALDPNTCVQILQFDGTMGTISGAQKTVLNVVAENAAEYQWFEASNPFNPIGNDHQLIVWENPGAGVFVTRNYYVKVFGKPGCSPATSDTAMVIIDGVGITDTFNIKTDPPSRIDSVPGMEIPITVEVVNWNPNQGGEPTTWPIEYEWFEGLTPDESNPAGGTQIDTPTSSTLKVRPFHNTSYWCKATIDSRRREFSLMSGTTRVFMPPLQVVRLVPHDFDGNGKGDILFRNTRTGEVRAWLMQDRTHTSNMSLGTAPLSQQLQTAGDLNGDFRPDLVFRNPESGANSVWFMSGTHSFPQPLPPNTDPNWSMGGVADMDADGAGDLLWYNKATGETRVWLMNGATQVGSWSIGSTAGEGWRLQGTADFDLDGNPDLFFRNYDTGENQAWLVSNLEVTDTIRNIGTNSSRGVETNELFPGTPIQTLSNVAWRPGGFDDYTNDGRPDIFWFDTVEGKSQFWWMGITNVGHITDGDTETDEEWQVTGTGEGPILAPGAGSTTLSVSASPATFGGSTTLTATLLATGASLSGKSISFTIAGTPVGTATTDAGGSASLAVSLSAYAAGMHSVTASFAGDSTLSPANATTTLVIDKAVPQISWATPAPINFGTPLSSAQLNATADVAGTFAYDPAAGTVLNAGTRTLRVTFTPSSANYSTATKEVVLVVRPATPSISWATPAAITYGTPLSAVQLNATASMPGTFSYDPPAGTILTAGQHILGVSFTPNDANFATAFASVTITVNKATPAIAWNAPAPIVFGTALSGTQLNATGNVAGTISYNPPAGTVLNAGTHSLQATFTPTDTANYNNATAGVTLVVHKATPVITWNAPAPIIYGTALSNAQLNATANVSGSFTYDPAAGTILNAGNRTLSTTFTPTDTANYNNATAGVTLVVNKATPVITWATPAAIVYGTALSSAQLNATANVSGSFTYDPAAGTILNAGNRTLNTTFTPADTANYNNATASVTLVVHKATPVITWATPAPIIYGTPLSGAQLNATANVAGTFAYAPPAGTVLEAGAQPLAVEFTPTDANNYNSATASITLTVQKATPVVTWPAPAAIVYGTALSSTQLNATANVPGAFDYTPAAGTILDAGARTLRTHFTPADTRNYNEVDAEVGLTVEKAPQQIDWAQPATIVYGTPLSAAQLNATVTVVGPSPAGAVTYTPPAGTVLDAGAGQLLTVTVSETANYLPATASVRIDVARAPLAVVVHAASKLYGAPLPLLGGSITGVRNNDDITPVYTTTATVASPVGTYPIEASLLDPNGRLRNYDVTITNATLTVLRAPLAIRVADSTKQYSDPLPLFIVTYHGFVLGETPAVLGGTLTFATTATALSDVGTYSVAASGLVSPNYDITWIPGTLTITPEDVRLTYNGSRLVAAGGLTGSNAALLLSTTLSDADDGAAGDIRTATVTFVDRATGATLCSAPIVLLDAADLRTGTVTCSATVDATGLTSINVGTTVSGNYQRNDAGDDVAIAVVAATADFLNGSGWIRAAASTGSLAADAGSKLQINADAKYKQNGLTAGVRIDSQIGPRNIRITATTVRDAAVKASAQGGAAEILATVKIEEGQTVIDPAATLLLAIADNDAPGRNDTFHLTVWSSDGKLLLTSRWDGLRTVPQNLDGGDLVVH